MDIFLARQGVYNRARDVEFYELLYRNSNVNRFDSNISAKNATYEVINNISCIGLDLLTNNKKALINCDEEVLLDEVITILSNKDIIIEVLEDVYPSDRVIHRIKELNELGYEIALDDVVDFNSIERYLPYVKYIKVDFLLTTPETRKKLIRKINESCNKVILLAEKIENEEEFKEAISLGFKYYQGYYFSKPFIVKGKDVAIRNKVTINLIKEITKEDFDLSSIEKLMKSDVALMYKFMKFINSAFFNFLQEVSSIRQAVMLVGQEQFKKWLSIISFIDLSDKNNKEYANLTIIRARLCELILLELNEEMANDGFLVGMFSDLELLVGDEISMVLNDLPFKTEIKNALNGEENLLKKSLDLTRAYEKMNINQIDEKCKEIGVEKERLRTLYLSAISWVQQLNVS